jgi:hypothetical protein
LHFAGAGFDEVHVAIACAAGVDVVHRADGDVTGEAHVVERFEFARFENDFEVCVRAVVAAAGFLGFAHFFPEFVVFARKEEAARDDHVDLVGTHAHGLADVFEADIERELAAGEARGDGGDFDAMSHSRDGCATLHCFTAQHLDAGWDEIGIDADCADAGQALAQDAFVTLVGSHGFGAEGADFFGAVFAFERCQVEHAEGDQEQVTLAGVLDRSFGERHGSLGSHGCIDWTWTEGRGHEAS